MKKILRTIRDHEKLHEVLENYEKFQTEPDPRKFAVIKIGGGLLLDHRQRWLIAQDLAALAQVDLYPIVVHGAGPQLDKKFKELGIETQRVNGIRKTPKVAATALAHTVHAVSLGLLNEMKAWGAPQGFISAEQGTLHGGLSDPEDLASVKELRVATGYITSTINAEMIPVLGSVGRRDLYWRYATPPFEPINLNADTAAAAIAVELGVHKYISLTKTGAILDANEQPISELAIDDISEMIASRVIHSGAIPKVLEGAALVKQGIGSVAITSPNNLLVELFTDGGKGTLIS